MLSRSRPVQNGHSESAIVDLRTNYLRGHFPESFSRTSPAQEDDQMSDASAIRSPIVGAAASPIPFDGSIMDDERSPSPQRTSRRNVMRLENILNDPSYERTSSYRSRSLCASPTLSEMDTSTVVTIIPQTRSVSPAERVVKRKKVKMHQCKECHKEFPRPSGLRTHMNMHTKEKPFPCTYPGCSRTFSVVSNAKRHMRTHGVGLPAEEQSSDASVPVPYVVGFEAPVVIAHPEADVKEPLKLRWISSATGASASGTGSGSSSAGSSRARSLSGAAGFNGLPLGGASSPITTPSTGSVGRKEDLLPFPSASSLDRRESYSGPPSPASYGSTHESNGHTFVRHRRVESEGSRMSTNSR